MTIVLAQNLRVPRGSLIVSRVVCLFICPCFSNVFVLGAGVFSSNVIWGANGCIGKVVGDSFHLSLSYSERVSPSPLVSSVAFVLAVMWSLWDWPRVPPRPRSPLLVVLRFFAAFLALSWICLSVCVFLLFAFLGRLC